MGSTLKGTDMFRLGTLAIALTTVAIAGAAQPAEYEVGQKNKTFSAVTLNVHVGDRIVFRNDDQITHNVFSTAKGNEFNLRAQAPGTSASFTLAAEGVVDVYCAFHPKMKLVVTVDK
jgi:plastocyanin